jgi:RecB family exonuclease
LVEPEAGYQHVESPPGELEHPLKIRFGLHLDGERGWHAGNRLAEPVMGPLSLLAWLETQLGLAGEFQSHAERIVQYRECLKACDTPARFYHKTFGADELGTAACLLDWRDTWYLHGWSGTFGRGASVRLGDMAVVEQRVAGSLGPSVGERLKRVAQALERKRPAIKSIALVDPLDAFPRGWRDVLAVLPVQQSMLSHPADEGTMLGTIQAALSKAHGGGLPTKVSWRDDGSVRVLRAETRLTAARWLSSEIRHYEGACLLVAEGAGALLDTVLDAADCARNGLEEKTEFRPALQVLPLALQTIWEPLDFFALLKFLTHPISPLPGHARRLLAAELADRPGIGGKGWNALLEKIVSHYGDKGQAVREDIRYWIEHPRFDPRDGVPITVVRERVARLAEYFAARLATHDKDATTHLAAAYAQVAGLAVNLEALAQQGEEILLSRTLQTLVHQVTGPGVANPLAEAEIGCLSAVTNSAAVIESFDRVIWWQLGAPVMQQRYPWSRREMQELVKSGVDLPSLDTVLARIAAEWLRPVFASREELTLVLPPKGEEVHPLWLMIEALVEGARIEPVEQVLVDANAASGLAEVALAPPLPRKRWWRLPDDARIPPRKHESYSSLEIFLNNPYEWVLKYVARLQPSSILSVSSDFRLFGNLAHRLIERFYRSDGALAISTATIECWFEQAFRQIVEEEGAVLLMRGRRPDLLKLRGGLRRALLTLHEQLNEARVVKVQPEVEMAGSFTGGELAGIADLVATKPGGARAILDMKWSGSRKYADMLAEGRHLQLAVYGELMRQGSGVWPHVAYFVLDQARLFAPDAAFFPGARVVAKQDIESAAHLWKQFLETWKWRRAQMDAGLIEVVIEGVEETEASIAPEGGLAVEVRDPRYNDYFVLAGPEEI